MDCCFTVRSSRGLVGHPRGIPPTTPWSFPGLDDARKTQADYPHLTVVSDEAHGLAELAGLIHPHAAPDGGDRDVPTTILVDRNGMVRWLYRSPSVVERLSQAEVLRT